MDNNYRQTNFLWGALVGGTVAALTTLLFTTKKGKQIQDQIGDAYDEVEETVKNKFAGSKEKLEEIADQAHKKMTSAPHHEDHNSKEKSEETADHAHKKMASSTHHEDHSRSKHAK